MDDTERAVAVVSELPPGETQYKVSIRFGNRIHLRLTAQEARDHAETVMRAISAVEYDAAIVSQLKEIGLNGYDTTAALTEITKRQPRTWTTGALTLTPCMFITKFTPVTFGVGITGKFEAGPQQWTWSPEQAEKHVRNVLKIASMVDCDTDYYSFWVNTVGLDPAKADKAVAQIWPGIDRYKDTP